MPEFTVTRAHLKKACETRNGDLLDRLLEISNELKPVGPVETFAESGRLFS